MFPHVDLFASSLNLFLLRWSGSVLDAFFLVGFFLGQPLASAFFSPHCFWRTQKERCVYYRPTFLELLGVSALFGKQLELHWWVPEVGGVDGGVEYTLGLAFQKISLTFLTKTF